MNDITVQAFSLAIQTRTPVILWGEPGVAKTAFTNRIASVLNKPLTTILASLREPQDFNGWPSVQPLSDKNNIKVMKFIPPDWAVKLQAGDIVFFDEITTTPPSTQSALLRVMHELVVGDFPLPPVSMAAAANPPDIAANGNELSPPLANRLMHLDWKHSNQRWIEYMAGQENNIPIPVLPKNWIGYKGQARALISAFIQHKPDSLQAMPTEDANKGHAWPSLRSWDNAATCLAAALSIGGEKGLVHEIMAGNVGEAKAGMFTHWKDNLDLPDPEYILKHPNKFDPGSRGDLAYAILSSVVSAVLNNNTPDRWQQAWEVLAVAGKLDHIDISIIPAQTLKNNKPEGAKINYKLLDPFTEFFQEAGIFPSDKK